MHARWILLVLSLTGAGIAQGQEGKPQALRISPEVVPAGGMIEVTAPLGGAATLEAAIGERRLVRIGGGGSRTARFLVPLLEPAGVEVAVYSGRERLGARPLSVLPSEAQRARLAFEGNAAKVLSVRATAGGVSEGAERGGRRISFDLVSREGRILFTRTIRHPTAGGMEVFEVEGAMRQVARPKSAVVAIKLPRTDGTAKLRLYDVAPGVDLGTEAGRRSRKFLRELRIQETPERR